MCTFLSTLPKQSKSVSTNRPVNIFLSLKPCPADDPRAFYRFRLLNFASKNSTRDYPFIEKYTHTVWGKTEDGKPMIESSVVCPVTKYVDWVGDRYDCPICKYASNNFISYKESNYKDKVSAEKNRKFSRKFEANIPVYVVNDPNYEGNNNKFKVITFTDKDKYAEFKELVNVKLREVSVFNGVAGVDFCIRIDKIVETVNAGQPNEYTWSHNVISKMLFSSKPYELPAITKEAVDAFPFDDQYYISSTKEELDQFYNKYCRVQMDDLDIEDEAITIVSTPTVKPAPVVTSPAKKRDIEETPVSNPAVVATPPANDISNDDIDDLLNDITGESKTATPPPATVEETPVQESSSLDDLDIDALLDDI